jgi:hypothetical protein
MSEQKNDRQIPPPVVFPKRSPEESYVRHRVKNDVMKADAYPSLILVDHSS